jgi:hypothetical protein
MSSMTETSSAYEQMLTMAAALTFSDKLRFNSDFAVLLKKDGKTGPVGKAAKKEKSESKKSSGTKRKSVWFAYVKHLKETMPERFAEAKGGPAQNTVASLIKEEDLATYEAYAAKFKLEHGSASSSASVVTEAESSSEAEAEAAPSSSEPSPSEPVQDKKAALAAAMAAKKAAAAAKLPASPKASKEEKEAAKEAEKTAKAAAKEAEKTAKAAAKEAEKAAKAAAKPKKEPKKVAVAAKAAAPVVAEAEVTMPKLTIAGTTYWHDESSNGLYAVEADDSFGSWVGFFQPGDEETPIRYTDSPADE